jgi:hypothetical protein
MTSRLLLFGSAFAIVCKSLGDETLAAPSRLPSAALAEVEAMVKAAGGHDLETKNLGLVAISGWEGFPTTLFEYAKTDRDGTRKPGLAVMLNPDAHQAARWIVQAVIDATGGYDAKKAQALVNDIRYASGFQFLVRGVHWEAMDGSPVHRAYPFRDGITVKLRAFGDGYPDRVLTAEELRYAIDAPDADVLLTAKYARIISTTRQDYLAAGGKASVDGHAWRQVVRELYQSAWGADRNELISARAKAKKW